MAEEPSYVDRIVQGLKSVPNAMRETWDYATGRNTGNTGDRSGPYINLRDNDLKRNLEEMYQLYPEAYEAAASGETFNPLGNTGLSTTAHYNKIKHLMAEQNARAKDPIINAKKDLVDESIGQGLLDLYLGTRKHNPKDLKDMGFDYSTKQAGPRTDPEEAEGIKAYNASKRGNNHSFAMSALGLLGTGGKLIGGMMTNGSPMGQLAGYSVASLLGGYGIPKLSNSIARFNASRQQSKAASAAYQKSRGSYERRATALDRALGGRSNV